jgi:transcriptional regulator with XRE-family HTH domain
MLTPREAKDQSSQEWQQIAERMGVSKSYVSKLANGQRRWTWEMQRRFAAAVGLDVSAISFDQDVHEL